MLGVRSKKGTLGVRVLLAVGLLFVGGLLGALVLKPKSADALNNAVTSGLFTVYQINGLTWQEAEAHCQANGQHLATIESADENTAIVQILLDQSMDNAWFGYNDIDVEAAWVWVDGSQSTYTNWAPDHPNNYQSNEDCGELWPNFNNGKWNDMNCESENVPGFVCKEAAARFVVFKRSGIRWANAARKCYRAGMVLATIHDAAENAEVRSLLDAQSMTRAWIGYNDRRREGSFTWLDRAHSRYTNWYPGEPNDSYGNEDCVEMYSRGGTVGKWNDVSCYATFVEGYVCAVL